MKNEDTRPFEIVWEEWHIELKCMLCGQYLGTLVQDKQHRNSHVIIHRNGKQRVVQLNGALLSRLQCGRCGGPVIPGDAEFVRRREPTERMYEKEPADIPRRGRPPTWLVEQRQREREELEQLELEVMSA